jgi:hypothetical protein
MNVTSRRRAVANRCASLALSTLRHPSSIFSRARSTLPFPGRRSHEARRRPIYGTRNSLLSIVRRAVPVKGPFLTAARGMPSMFPSSLQTATHRGTHPPARQRSGTPVYLALRTTLWGAENSCRRSKVTPALHPPRPLKVRPLGITTSHTPFFSIATLPSGFDRVRPFFIPPSPKVYRQ